MASTKFVHVEALPERTVLAAYDILAGALRYHSPELKIILPDSTEDGDPVGSFVMSVRAIAENGAASSG